MSDRPPLPTGTVTLLLGDIEGSTRLWETRSEEMAAALAELNRLIDDTVGARHGARPVEQGEGDSFVAGFARCSDAVACAVDLARATSDGLLRLRMGIHTGEVQLREGGNYMGPAVNRTARIRDAANGGQIVLSQTAADLAADDLPAGAGLLDLGQQRLRDLARPERLWQLTHPDIPDERRPLRTSDAGRNNLPTQLTSFVGRESALRELHELLDTARAVTLTGAGGCGKTRLAVEVSAQRLTEYPGGVFFVDLAPTNEVDGVAAALATAMGVVLRPSSPAESIAAAIGPNHTLLVFDNCEHLVEQCAGLAEDLLRRCSGLVVMATSREPLALSGEVTYRVPSLSLPPDSVPDDVAGLESYEAVQLFVERARRARPAFTLDLTNSSAVIEVCRRLDGIPLAIELAAARLRVLSPTQLRDGLNDRFRLLTGGARTAVPRQQTLQASVEWSYALLLEPERILLNRLSVFAGGFDVSGAEIVCAGGALEAHHVLELLTQLVDKSLVVAHEHSSSGKVRFSLLETVRAYCAARLVDSGEAESVRARHYDWCSELADQGPDGEGGYRVRISAEYDNIRRALQWAEGQSDPAALGRLASRLYLFWATSTKMAEGAQWMEKVVEREDDPGRLANAVGRLALLLSMSGDYDRAMSEGHRAVDMTRALGDKSRLTWTLLYLAQGFPTVEERVEILEEASALATETGDVQAQAWALYQLGWMQQDVDPLGAMGPLEQSVGLASTHGYGWIERLSRAALAIIRARIDPLAETLPELEAATAALRDAGEGALLGTMYAWLALFQELLGDPQRADETMEEQRRFADVSDVPDNRARRDMTRAWVHIFRGEWKTAHEAVTDTLDYLREPGMRYHALVMAALTELMTGSAERALEQSEESAALVGLSSFQISPIGSATHVMSMACRALGDLDRAEDLARTALAEVHSRPVTSYVRTGPMRVLASVLCRSGRVEDAVRLFAAIYAETLRSGGVAENGLAMAEADGQVEAARGLVGTERWQELWEEGRAMSWPDAVAYAQRGRGERKRPKLGWESLTPTEVQVVELVATGASNTEIAERLIMAVPTVKTHLTHVYGKLGLTTRSQLAAAAVRRAATL